MKSFKLKPAPGPKRSGSGAYNFDNGSVAFSDITEHKRTAREYNKEYYRKVVKSSHVNRGYKLKHG